MSSRRRRAWAGLGVALLISLEASSQEKVDSSLDSLWRDAWKESGKIMSAEALVAAASAQGDMAIGAYYPALKTSFGRTKNAISLEDEGSWFGDWSAEASLQQSIPGGGALSLGGADALSEVDFYDARRKLQYPSFSIAYSQSLWPYWLDRGARNPVTEGPRLRLKQAELDSRKNRRDLALDAAERYIALRDCERGIAYSEQSVARLEETLRSRKSQLARGSISIADAWEAESALWDEKNRLLQSEAKAAEIRQSLFQMTGTELGAVADLSLPTLPDTAAPGASLEEEELLVSLKGERSSIVEQRQKEAPVLDVAFKRAFVVRPQTWDSDYDSSYSLTSKSYWSLSLGLTISASFFANWKLEEELGRAYELRHESLLSERTRYVSSRRRLLELHESGLEAQRVGIVDELHRVERISEDAQAMLKSGQVSELQAWQNRLGLLRARNDLSSVEDQLWLTRLYLASLRGWPEGREYNE